MINRQRGIAFDDKIPIIFDYVGGKIEGYTEPTESSEGYIDISKTQKETINSLRTPYILVKRNKKNINKTLKEEYHDFIRDANELKKQTNGLINMYRTGSDKQTAINLAYHFLNKDGIVAEPIDDPMEAKWIDDAVIGALVFAEKYEGTAHVFDINSSYPSIYSSPLFMIPMKKGIFKKLSREEFGEFTFFPHGIYRVKIRYPDEDPKWKKLFRLNEKNKYTHIDVGRAKELGLIIKLREKGKYNFLNYPKDQCLISGSKCFKKFVDLLFKLRSNEICGNRCKSILNSLWGALVQKDKYTLHSDLTKDGEENEITANLEDLLNHKSIDFISETKIIIKKVSYNNLFKTNYARIKPFLLAKGRSKISKLIEPYVDHVYRCHTDSMVSDIKLPIKTSTKIGDVKYVGYYKHCIIKNCASPIGTFTKCINSVEQNI